MWFLNHSNRITGESVINAISQAHPRIPESDTVGGAQHPVVNTNPPGESDEH